MIITLYRYRLFHKLGQHNSAKNKIIGKNVFSLGTNELNVICPSDFLNI